jgi:hypothetical protein
MSKTINQALKDLYLSLGGDPSALEDNSTVSDYIKDLESGLKGLAELPAPSSDNAGKIAKVVSDGEGGYIWGADTAPSEICYINATSGNNDDITFEEGVFDKLSDAFTNNKLVFVKVGGTMSYSNADIIIPVAFSSTSALPYFIAFEGGIVTKKDSDMYALYISATGASSSVNGNVDFRKIS